ncbi:M20/M25/M40 family metallo-hydrolase [Sphingomicrobium astaxanthinifaciens]|uniref:M20/M25/M40 family metallo-hydrolase n=1 Tax=Sphingomicrobium astaxanthinifaciens TaxID=1227949 RepID=UPI001FCC2E78|nr:M20/M25/M40 family metallo-hydrolase [Sphingomicrobium astaxanthinifaciens]MCJ7422347.1 M20/M25/M40 family metallo-hydrolase [Sphingomicrobium astaxanthinifaciens]
MTRTLALAALAALPLSSPASAHDLERERLLQAQAEALEDAVAWDILEDLTTEVGPRLGGTPAEARARAWATERLTALGFANVRVEDYRMPTWVRGEEKARLTGPYPQDLALTALGNSGSTGPAGLTAEVVGYVDYAAFLADDPANQAGRIVFISNAMPRNQDGSGYSMPFGAPRWVGPNEAAKRGAAAIVVRSIGTDHNRTPHTGNTSFEEGVDPIPAAALAVPDAEQLMRVLERAETAVRMELLLTPRRLGMQPSGNVIAEVPGRDPSAKKVLVGCHLDSWDNAPGVFDDGAGCAIVAAAAKRVMDMGTPARTIEIVWFGAEEVGLWGARDFAERHDGTDYHVVAESDFGADRVWKVTTDLGEHRRAEADALRAALAPLGIASGDYDQAGGADVGPLRAEGAPGLSLRQDGTRYFDLHHTANDTLDKVDPAQLRQNVAAWTTMLLVMAGPVE